MKASHKPKIEEVITTSEAFINNFVSTNWFKFIVAVNSKHSAALQYSCERLMNIPETGSSTSSYEICLNGTNYAIVYLTVALLLDCDKLTKQLVALLKDWFGYSETEIKTMIMKVATNTKVKLDKLWKEYNEV